MAIIRFLKKCFESRMCVHRRDVPTTTLPDGHSPDDHPIQILTIPLQCGFNMKYNAYCDICVLVIAESS